MEKQLDDGQNTVTASDKPEADNRAIANAKAAEIAGFITASENKLAITAKEHGVAMLRAHYRDGVSLDVLIGENKLAAGFKTLGSSDAGKKAKSRLNNYFSTYRLLAERWSSIEDDKRNAMLNGETSPHYIAALIRKADAEAAKEAAKAEAEAEAETPAVATLADEALRLLALYQAASMDERNAAFDALASLFEAVDADTVAQQTETETETPVAVAA
jgi:hypothetical protein